MAEYDGRITVKLGLEPKEYEEGLKGAVNKTESFTDKVKSTFVGATVFKVAQKGWDLISGSIEKATNRLDAMQKAKQVMGILAGSTEKAEEVVSKLNDAVTDTAYGLDAASTSTQKLATSGLGLDKSSQMVKDMMDAVSFYGDGTNATLENTIDAIAKMNSSGKISADQWQRLTDAGIPVLKIFSEKTGQSMAEVSDAFSKGKISAQEFNDILMDALENGTESFPAVAGKAKEMAGSFATSFSNMSARIAIGVGNVITAFNNFLQDSGLPSIQESIAGFGSVIKNGLNWVADNLPTVLNGAKEVITGIVDAMPGLTSAIQGVIDYVQQNAGPILDTIKGALGWFIEQIPVLAGVIDSLMPVIASVLTLIAMWKGYTMLVDLPVKILAIKTAVGNLVGTVKSFFGILMANPIALVVAAIAALVAAFVYLWNTSEDFRNFWINLWDKVKEVVGNVVDWLKGAWDTAVTTIENVWNGIVDFFQGLADGIQNAWSAVVEFFTVTIPEAFQAFIDKCIEVKDNVVNFFTVTIPEAITNFVNSIIQFFGTDLPYYIGYGVGFIIGKVAEFGDNLVSFVTETIPQFIDDLVAWFAQLPERIWEWLQQTLTNFHDWCTQTVDAGIQAGSDFVTNVVSWISQLPGQIWDWLTNAIHNVEDWVNNMASKAVEAGSNFLDGVITWIKQVPGKVYDWIIQTLTKVNNWAGDLKNAAIDAGMKFFNGIVDEVKKVPDKMLEIGGNIVEGIKNGIKNAWDGLKNWFSGLASGLVDGFTSALGIHSPSRVFRNKAKWIPEGMAEGIKDTMPKVMKLMKSAGDEMSDAFNTDELSSRITLDGRVSNAKQAVAGNSYVVNQTINSHDALSPSEMAQETKNTLRRIAWQ